MAFLCLKIPVIVSKYQPKKEHTMSTQIKLLFKIMKGKRLLYLFAILSIGIATLFALLPPVIIKITIDSVLGDKSFSPFILKIVNSIGGSEFLKHNLWICGLSIVFIMAFNCFFQFLKGRLASVAAEKIARDLREQLYNTLQNLPFQYHVMAHTGDLIQRCTSDVETIRRFLASQLTEMGRCIFIIILSVIIMFSLNVKMAFLSIMVLPIIFVYAYIFFKKVQKRFKLVDEKEGELSSVVQENLTGVRVVRAFGRANFEIAKFETKNKQFVELVLKLNTLLAWYWSISDFLCFTQIVVVLAAGTYFTVNGVITLGTLVLFNSYILMVLWPARQLGRILTDMGKTYVSLTRIFEILDTPQEIDDKDALCPSLRGDIKFENLNFEYEKNKPVLKNISFDIKKGETIAILGQTGAGKSSLMHILLRLYDYQSGTIKINGIELKHIDKKWLRKNIGIVLQEPFLYSKTIKENLKMARSNVSEHEIIEATTIASVHDVIESFEKGYETPIGERGVTLSGGQKQRVAIARTLIKNCAILIFDDSLSAVDTETDAEIRSALKEKSNDVTTFIISHRITTLAQADRIIVIENGELKDIGSHDELIKKEGLYSRIWSIQNMLEDDFILEESLEV